MNLNPETWRKPEMRLEVGCGYVAEGDVNVDLHIQPTSHRTGKSV